jgi:ribosomal protein S2
MCDSDMDPAAFLYPVFGNDDSLEALELLAGK